MRRVTPAQQKALERLQEFRFLTTKQFQRLGVSKNQNYIRDCLRPLLPDKNRQQKTLIQKQSFWFHPSKGQDESLYFLTKSGAEFLAEYHRIDPKAIYYPKQPPEIKQDYFHRVQTIDLHISARLLCESTPGSSFDCFQGYFYKQGSNRTPDNLSNTLCKIDLGAGQYFIPDCVFRITDPTGKPWLFTAEIYRNHTTDRTHRQLNNHLRAIGEGSISQHYDFPRAVPVLIVCESEAAMRSLMRRCADDPMYQHTEDYFLFRTHADLLARPFYEGWQTYKGSGRVLFQ